MSTKTRGRTTADAAKPKCKSDKVQQKEQTQDPTQPAISHFFPSAPDRGGATGGPNSEPEAAAALEVGQKEQSPSKSDPDTKGKVETVQPEKRKSEQCTAQQRDTSAERKPEKARREHEISDSGSETEGAVDEETDSDAEQVTSERIVDVNNTFDEESVAEMGNTGNSSSSGSQESSRKKPTMMRSYSEMDTEDYRLCYPDKKDDPNLKENLKFYMNERPSYPEGAYIQEIHRKWKGNYRLLEAHHGYIQWLFPIRESGMNFHAQELQLHEAEAIKSDKAAHQRVLESYKVMLDFYGMALKNENTGEVTRAENWKSRFQHLNRSFHNYLRITRILKSLGELGYEHFKPPFVKFVMDEAFRKETLPNCRTSCLDYWVHILRDETEREKLCRMGEELCPKKQQKSWLSLVK